MTLVDSGTVSFSNPVRQTLFTFEDCLHGGAPKAETAARRLKDILPTADVSGVRLTIPMPGHPVSESALEATLATVDKLTTLVAEHDAVFLLLDTREARWLPTLLCAAQDKICLTAAVGFDTFVAMRHGVRSEPQTPRNVGCYFCNDVVAPTNVCLLAVSPAVSLPFVFATLFSRFPIVLSIPASRPQEFFLTHLGHRDDPLTL